NLSISVFSSVAGESRSDAPGSGVGSFAVDGVALRSGAGILRPMQGDARRIRLDGGAGLDRIIDRALSSKTCTSTCDGGPQQQTKHRASMTPHSAPSLTRRRRRENRRTSRKRVGVWMTNGFGWG